MNETTFRIAAPQEYQRIEAAYAAAGFVPSTDVPPFLSERAESYRARGLDVLVMRRPLHNT